METVNKNDEKFSLESKHLPPDEAADKNEKCVQEDDHTTIKNANATGLGAIGRSDEKVEDTAAGKPADTGDGNLY
jgi:hypothetical protein